MPVGQGREDVDCCGYYWRVVMRMMPNRVVVAVVVGIWIGRKRYAQCERRQAVHVANITVSLG